MTCMFPIETFEQVAVPRLHSFDPLEQEPHCTGQEQAVHRLAGVAVEVQTAAAAAAQRAVQTPQELELQQ